MRFVLLLVSTTLMAASSASAQILLERKASYDGEPPAVFLLLTAMVALPFVLRKRRAQEL
jgi:hypothetical protein